MAWDAAHVKKVEWSSDFITPIIFGTGGEVGSDFENEFIKNSEKLAEFFKDCELIDDKDDISYKLD